MKRLRINIPTTCSLLSKVTVDLHVGFDTSEASNTCVSYSKLDVAPLRAAANANIRQQSPSQRNETGP